MPEFGFRYYDPNTGQWLSREPLGENESLNLYAYCHNDPINKVDVLGLREVTVVSPDPLNRFRRNANGEWEVRMVTQETGFWGNKTDFVRDFWDPVSKHDGPLGPLAGYVRYTENGGVTSEGSDFIVGARQATGWDENAVRDLTVISGASMAAILAAPAAIAYGPAAVTEGGILLHGYGSAAASSIGSTTVTVGGTGMLGSGTTYTLAQIGTATGITAETGMLAWVLGTEEGREYGSMVGSSGLPPQQQAAMLGLGGPTAMIRSSSWFRGSTGATGTNPTLFLNNFPDDPTGPPIQTIAPEQLSKISRRLNYVVLQDGSLVLGRRANQLGGGHIDLAGGAPVLAAGEVKIVNGTLRYVDNTSGHYLPFGPDAEAAAIRAFQQIGFDDIPYAEKVWSDSVRRWMPVQR